MTWEAALIGLSGLCLSAASFLLGKIFSQSENILERKRTAYRDFLKFCPSPNEAHLPDQVSSVEMQREIGILTLYASAAALKFAGEYFQAFADAQDELVDVEVAGHPTFIKVMTAYNRMVWEMRADAMTWSVFAPNRKGREYKPSMNPEAFEK